MKNCITFGLGLFLLASSIVGFAEPTAKAQQRYVVAYMRVIPDYPVYYENGIAKQHKNVYRHRTSGPVKSSTPAYTFADKREATGNATFIFDPKIHMWGAYDANGDLVRTGHASGGRNFCPDINRPCHTPAGTFSVQSKGGPGCKSSIYPIGKGGAPMPYCMFFHRGYAVHGSYDVPNHNASHGCVRVTPSDADWLSHNFMKIGTTVIVRPY